MTPRQPFSNSSNQQPTTSLDLSIIICTYNGADKIEKTLQSIVDQKAECSRELIVVDNASTDDTAKVVSAFFKKQQVNVLTCKLVYEAVPGLIYARLAGIKVAIADIMLFCDDDNILCESYVQTGYEIMKANPLIGALGGCGIAEFEGDKPVWFDTYYHSFAVGSQSDIDGKLTEYPAQIYGAGSFFRKLPLDLFFNNKFKSRLSGRTGKKLTAGDDVELCFLVQLTGYQIWYNSSLIFKHLLPVSRLKWEYYVKMKVGIAASDSAFLPYSVLFSSTSNPLFYILKESLRKFILYGYIFSKEQIRYFFYFGRLNNNNHLARLLYRAKFISYIYNPFSAYRHYRFIKNILKYKLK